MNISRAITCCVLLALVGAAGAQSRPSAFGYRLGDQFDTSQAARRVDIQGRYSVFVVAPKEAFLGMRRILLTLTKNGEIRSIEGVRSSANCNNEIADVKRSVESAYWFEFKFEDRFFTGQGGMAFRRGIDRHEVSIICSGDEMHFSLDANWFGSDDFK